MATQLSPHIQSLYDAATQILHDCDHPPLPGHYPCEVRMGKGIVLPVCMACWNAHVAARRAARKAQLAERPNDCDRCGQKPSRWTYGRYALCGRCKTATEREHYKALANAGALGIFATSLLVNTDTWALHAHTGD